MTVAGGGFFIAEKEKNKGKKDQSKFMLSSAPI